MFLALSTRHVRAVASWFACVLTAAAGTDVRTAVVEFRLLWIPSIRVFISFGGAIVYRVNMNWLVLSKLLQTSAPLGSKPAPCPKTPLQKNNSAL